MTGERGLFVLLLAALLSYVLPLSPAHANDVETIVKALTPKPRPPLTRSFAPAPTRGIDVQGGEPQQDPAPTIDLYVNFEFDQSNLTMSDAQFTVDTLGRALKDARLANMRFQIIGHTDARGSDEYNLELSRRRADAVRSRLMQFHQVEGHRLMAEGRGMRDLKDTSRPEDAINRRVQIKTISDRTS